jgi:hypothetical protein
MRVSGGPATKAAKQAAAPRYEDPNVHRAKKGAHQSADRSLTNRGRCGPRGPQQELDFVVDIASNLPSIR